MDPIFCSFSARFSSRRTGAPGAPAGPLTGDPPTYAGRVPGRT